MQWSHTIDALEQGALARYLNHSARPNCSPFLATLDHVSHVIILTNKAIAKGEQLCYDYGPDYWAKRKAPIPTPNAIQKLVLARESCRKSNF